MQDGAVVDCRAEVKCEVRSARCEVVKCEVPVRGINARRRVICEAGMCEAQRTTVVHLWEYDAH